jgi:hypothetical protein
MVRTAAACWACNPATRRALEKSTQCSMGDARDSATARAIERRDAGWMPAQYLWLPRPYVFS